MHVCESGLQHFETSQFYEWVSPEHVHFCKTKLSTSVQKYIKIYDQKSSVYLRAVKYLSFSRHMAYLKHCDSKDPWPCRGEIPDS